MSQTGNGRVNGEVSRLLADAAKYMAQVRYCWLVTESESGGASARPMGRLTPEIDDSSCTVCFITDGRTRKACDIRGGGKVVIIFQHDQDDAFIALSGRATLIETAAEVGRRWKDAYDAYYPTEADRANASFVQISVQRMELWIRGVTPEPYGLRTTVLERDAKGTWHLSPDIRNAA